MHDWHCTDGPYDTQLGHPLWIEWNCWKCNIGVIQDEEPDPFYLWLRHVDDGTGRICDVWLNCEELQVSNILSE